MKKKRDLLRICSLFCVSGGAPWRMDDHAKKAKIRNFVEIMRSFC